MALKVLSPDVDSNVACALNERQLCRSVLYLRWGPAQSTVGSLIGNSTRVPNLAFDRFDLGKKLITIFLPLY